MGRVQDRITWFIEKVSAKNTHYPQPPQPSPPLPKPTWQQPDVELRRITYPDGQKGFDLFSYLSEKPSVAAAHTPIDIAGLYEDQVQPVTGIPWPTNMPRMTPWIGAEQGGVAGGHPWQYRYHEIQDHPVQPPDNPPGWGHTPPTAPPGGPDPRGAPPPGFNTWGS